MGGYIGKYKTTGEISERFGLNRSGICNALYRGIRYKQYLFYRSKKKFTKYIPNETQKVVYINVYTKEGLLIEVVKGLKKCAKKYSLNVNSLNSRCRRKTIVNDIYFEKSY